MAPIAAATPDPHAVLVVQIQAVLGRVAEWSRSHAGAPCPDAASLGIAALDPWGHPIELTCTDQPADQMMGALSAGPDGIRGSSDDVKSWNLGPGVTQLVQGPRWSSRPVATKPSGKRRRDTPQASERIPGVPRTAPPSGPSGPAPPAPPAPPVPPVPIDAGDDIPTRR